MDAMDRRRMLTLMIGAAAAAAVASNLIPQEAEAATLTPGVAPAKDETDLVHQAQVVIVGPRRRRRRGPTCWWSRGRRVCRW
jgi:hypothetical protein